MNIILLLLLVLASFCVIGKVDTQNHYAKNAFVQQCEVLKKDDQKIEFVFNVSDIKGPSREPSLYVVNSSLLSGEWIVIDTTVNERQISDTFKLPIHTIIHKIYLKKKRLLLLGDGKNYSLLEKHALKLKKYFAEDVKIFHGNLNLWLGETSEVNDWKVMKLTPAELISESQLGRWSYIYHREDLLTIFKNLSNGTNKFKFLDRFVVMKEEVLKNISIPDEFKSRLYQLEGGEKAIEIFNLNHSRILSASRNRRLKEQCKTYHENS